MLWIILIVLAVALAMILIPAVLTMRFHDRRPGEINPYQAPETTGPNQRPLIKHVRYSASIPFILLSSVVAFVGTCSTMGAVGFVFAEEIGGDLYYPLLAIPAGLVCSLVVLVFVTIHGRRKPPNVRH